MAKLKSPKRQIANKVWICDIINSNFVKKEGWEPSYIEVGDKNISRVNIISTVVGKFVSEDGNYANLTLDDGTETIRVKAFGPDVSKILVSNIGDIIQFIGKVKKYEDEIYVSPEVIRVLDDPNWLIVRKLELKSPKKQAEEAKSSKEKKEETEEETVEDDSTDLIQIIRKLDKGEGASIDKVIEKSGLDIEEAKNFLFSLLKRGEIFEPKKGKLKVLD